MTAIDPALTTREHDEFHSRLGKRYQVVAFDEEKNCDVTIGFHEFSNGGCWFERVKTYPGLSHPRIIDRKEYDSTRH